MLLAGHHPLPHVWVLRFYFIGLNLSNWQIALELGLAVSDVQAMTEQLRARLVGIASAVKLEPDARASSGIDEVYVVARHKGQPEEIAKRGDSGGVAGRQVRRDVARWRGTRCRLTSASSGSYIKRADVAKPCLAPSPPALVA